MGAPEGRGNVRVERPPQAASSLPSAATGCAHCGTLVEGRGILFCCAGCEMAAAIIRGAGLERYYVEREALPPRPEPIRTEWDAGPVTSRDDGTCEIALTIDGLRCASCVWVTERVLERTEGVLDATVSYATGRAYVRWDPERTGLGRIVGRVAALGYRPRMLSSGNRRDDDLLMRLGVSAFAMANVMMFSAALYAGWFGTMDARFVTLFQWLSLVLATPVAIWCAAPFFAGAWSGLRHGVLHMDLPIALAIAVLWGHGVVGTMAGFDTYLDSLTMLVTLLLAGRLLESGGRRRSAEAATSLAATVPATARRVTPTSLEVVPSETLRPGDLVDVGAGEEIPADGRIAGGTGRVRRALLTGESAPVEAREGDEVWAGTVLVDGALRVEVAVPSAETLVRRMADQLRRSADRGVTAGVSDRIAPWFTAATLAVAGVTWVGWYAAAGVGVAVTTTVAVLVVACPCALALSRPLAAAAGLGAAARRGVLFRSGDAVLATADIDLVALDKTGTITEGTSEIIRATNGALRVAAGIERFSRHPLASAIVREAIRRGLALPAARDVQERPGVGIEGIVDESRWRIRSGRPGALILERVEGHESWEIEYGDRLRSGSRRAIETLRDLGVEVVMLTGDRQTPADQVAAACAEVAVLSELDPAGKASRLREWRQEGRCVLFAGDGLNDGPALAEADVAVAMGAGATSSILAADAVIAVESIEPLAAAVRVSRECRRAVRRSQIRSIAYNVGAVGAAAAGLVNPLVAALLMPLSSGAVLFEAWQIEGRVRRGETT